MLRDTAGHLSRPRIPRAARSFLEAYEPRALFMVQTGLGHQQREGATDVRWLPPLEVAGAVREHLSR